MPKRRRKGASATPRAAAGNAAPGPPTGKWWRDLGHAWWTGIGSVAGVLSLVVAVVALIPGRSNPSPDGRAGRSGVGTPSGGAPGQPPGSYPGALTITLNTLNSAPSFDMMFRRADSAAAAPYMKPGPLRVTPADIHTPRAYRAGAYAVGGIELDLDAESNVDRKLTIYDIRPIATPGPIVDGPLVAMSNEGTSADQIQFILDEPAPTATAVSQQVMGELGGPFFRSRTIILGKGEKDTMNLSFFALTASYSFRVAVDFEVGGNRYTQTVDDAGRPFRVTPDLCYGTYQPWRFRPALLDRAAKTLRPYRPSAVNELRNVRDFEVVSPDAYLAESGCRTVPK